MRPDSETGELKSLDDIYYGVLTDMQLFQPFGCKAYINIAKEVRRKNHKESAESAIFVGFEENTMPGYKCNRPLYRDFVKMAHARLIKFTQRSNINLTSESDNAELKEGTADDTRYI